MVLCLAILVFVLCAIPVQDARMIYLTNDETGIFAIAAHMAGADWSHMMQPIYYYSFGFSFFIYPLFLLLEDPVHIYQAALVINCAMVASIIPLSYSILAPFLKNASFSRKVLGYAVVLCVALYLCNIPRANLGLGETALTVINWGVFAVLFRVKREASPGLFVGLGLLVGYGYMVHQRFLGCMAACVITLFLLLVGKRIKGRQFFVFFCVLGAMLILQMVLKEYFQSTVWAYGDSLAANDYSNQWNKVTALFSLTGIRAFLLEVVGQLFYVGASTFLVAYFAIFHLFRKLPGFLRSARASQDFPVNTAPLLYLLGASIFTYLISIVFLSNWVRSDQIFYGRYNESIIGPLLLVGLWMLFTHRYKLRVYVACGGIFTAIALVVHFLCSGTHYLEGHFLLFNVYGLYPYLQNGNHHGELNLWLAYSCTLAVAVVFCVAARINKDGVKTTFVLALAAYYAFIGLSSTYVSSVPAGKISYEQNGLAEIIREDPQRRPVYFTSTSERERTIAASMQFLLKDIPLYRVGPAELSTDGTPYYIVCPSLTMLEIDREYRYVGTQGNTVLLECTGKYAPRRPALPLEWFETQTGKITKDQICSVGMEGYLMYGPHTTLPAGRAEWTVEMELDKPAQGLIGILEVVAQEDGDTVVLWEDALRAEDFTGGRLTLTAGIETDVAARNVEVRLFLNEDVWVDVISVGLEIMEKG